ncbi:MAG: YraN family protein [Anaerolineae bacterium]|nr:YraN family protein [Anaerolineae bacterium]
MVSEKVSTTETGRYGEDIAVQALRAHGYEIVERNWRCRIGEVDIVARQGEEWVFVEVKTRQGTGHGTPEEAVTGIKRSRLLRVAAAYLSEHEVEDAAWRVDVVAIDLGSAGTVRRLAIYRDAIQADMNE